MNTQKCLLTTIFVLIIFWGGCASENEDWENAKKENSIISYQNFLQSYPEGIFADSASLLLEELHFYEARSINTIATSNHGLQERTPQWAL